MAGASVSRVTDITSDLKDILLRYLRKERDALLGTLDGLDERQIRWPLTPTGTNLLGLVKHTASVSLGYFGETFGRDHGQAIPWFDEDADVNDDMWATADETREQIVALYQASARRPTRPSPRWSWSHRAGCRGGPRAGTRSRSAGSWCT